MSIHASDNYRLDWNQACGAIDKPDSGLWRTGEPPTAAAICQIGFPTSSHLHNHIPPTSTNLLLL